MEKIPLILFSGGLDSTFLLYHTLQSGPCDVLYADGGQSSIKFERELQARKEIIAYCNEICPFKVQQEHMAPNRHVFACGADVRYSQPMAWISAALCCIDAHRHSELLIGYVCDDGGFARWLPDVRQVWESAQRFTKVHGVVPVDWPLIDLRKVDILDRIDTELATKIWVCEMPKKNSETGVIKACGKCNPCRTLRTALRDYREIEGYDFMTKVLYTRAKVKRDAEAKAVEPPKSGGGFHTRSTVINRHHNDIGYVYVPRAGKRPTQEEELKVPPLPLGTRLVD